MVAGWGGLLHAGRQHVGPFAQPGLHPVGKPNVKQLGAAAAESRVGQVQTDLLGFPRSLLDLDFEHPDRQAGVDQNRLEKSALRVQLRSVPMCREARISEQCSARAVLRRRAAASVGSVGVPGIASKSLARP